MAGISKKKVKTKTGFVIKYTITYRDVFGVQHTCGIYDTQKEAKRHLWRFEEVENDNKNITYGLIFDEFLKRAKKKYADNTYKNYQSYYDRFFSKVESVQYSKIKSITWQNFFDDLEENQSPHTAAACLKFARAAANYAQKHNLVNDNIFSKIEKIKMPKADINHLTVEKLKFVLEECKKSYPQYYTLLYTFIGTGAREGEIFALNKADFNHEEKTLKIDKQFTRNKLKLSPKTSTSNRKIYIFDDLANLLSEHVKTLDNSSPLLFPNKTGNYINASNFRERFWKPLLKLCKIEERIRLHDLRGSYIDMLLSSGLSIKFAQNQAGHSKSETTLNVYAKNNQDMIQSATQKIDNIFSKKCEQNVSKTQKPPNKKIIHFPKRHVDIMF